MSDATRLHMALRDYIDALDAHSAGLREEYRLLQGSWHATRAVYQGEGADMFEEAFRRASAMLEDYLRAADVITPEMQRRLDALEQFDSGKEPSA